MESVVAALKDYEEEGQLSNLLEFHNVVEYHMSGEHLILEH